MNKMRTHVIQRRTNADARQSDRYQQELTDRIATLVEHETFVIDLAESDETAKHRKSVTFGALPRIGEWIELADDIIYEVVMVVHNNSWAENDLYVRIIGNRQELFQGLRCLHV